MINEFVTRDADMARSPDHGGSVLRRLMVNVIWLVFFGSIVDTLK